MPFNSPTFCPPAIVEEMLYPPGTLVENQLRCWAISRCRGPTEFSRFFLGSCFVHLPEGTPRMFTIDSIRMGGGGMQVTFTNPHDAHHLLGRAFWCGSEFICFTICNIFTQWDFTFPTWNHMHSLHLGYVVSPKTNSSERRRTRAIRPRVATRLFVATATVNLYVKCGQIAKAREVFDRMPEKDAVAWGAMVGGYASSGHPREALELFFAMRNQGVRPDCYTVADALSACTRLGKLDLGRRAAGAVDWDEFLDDPVLGAALIDLYVKGGSTWDAWSVFQQMRNRDIVVWNKMISGLGTTGHGKTAFALVGQMEKSGMKLNDSTFVGILCSCAHTGLVKDGWRYFHNMVELYRFIPRVDHYGCMVDLLSRAGLLQEAHRLINDMPMKANAVVWGALLGGCKIH
ncbi:hypothetical protein ACQ4PT_042741 [Festuca glaucescens]